MEISPVGGAGHSAARIQPEGTGTPGSPQAAGGLPANGNGVPSPGSTAPGAVNHTAITQSSYRASNSQSTIMFDDSARPSTSLALAMYILSALLQNSSEEEEDKFMMGLAAGLMASEQQSSNRMFFSSSSSSSSMSASSTTTVGSEQVNAAYNTEMPNVAASPSDASGPATDGNTMPVQRINTSA